MKPQHCSQRDAHPGTPSSYNVPPPHFPPNGYKFPLHEMRHPTLFPRGIFPPAMFHPDGRFSIPPLLALNTLHHGGCLPSRLGSFMHPFQHAPSSYCPQGQKSPPRGLDKDLPYPGVGRSHGRGPPPPAHLDKRSYRSRPVNGSPAFQPSRNKSPISLCDDNQPPRVSRDMTFPSQTASSTAMDMSHTAKETTKPVNCDERPSAERSTPLDSTPQSSKRSSPDVSAGGAVSCTVTSSTSVNDESLVSVSTQECERSATVNSDDHEPAMEPLSLVMCSTSSSISEQIPPASTPETVLAPTRPFRNVIKISGLGSIGSKIPGAGFSQILPLKKRICTAFAMEQDTAILPLRTSLGLNNVGDEHLHALTDPVSAPKDIVAVEGLPSGLSQYVLQNSRQDASKSHGTKLPPKGSTGHKASRKRKSGSHRDRSVPLVKKVRSDVSKSKPVKVQGKAVHPKAAVNSHHRTRSQTQKHSSVKTPRETLPGHSVNSSSKRTEKATRMQSSVNSVSSKNKPHTSSDVPATPRSSKDKGDKEAGDAKCNSSRPHSNKHAVEKDKKTPTKVSKEVEVNTRAKRNASSKSNSLTPNKESSCSKLNAKKLDLCKKPKGSKVQVKNSAECRNKSLDRESKSPKKKGHLKSPRKSQLQSLTSKSSDDGTALQANHGSECVQMDSVSCKNLPKSLINKISTMLEVPDAKSQNTENCLAVLSKHLSCDATCKSCPKTNDVVGCLSPIIKSLLAQPARNVDDPSNPTVMSELSLKIPELITQQITDIIVKSGSPKLPSILDKAHVEDEAAEHQENGKGRDSKLASPRYVCVKTGESEGDSHSSSNLAVKDLSVKICRLSPKALSEKKTARASVVEKQACPHSLVNKNDTSSVSLDKQSPAVSEDALDNNPSNGQDEQHGSGILDELLWQVQKGYFLRRGEEQSNVSIEEATSVTQAVTYDEETKSHEITAGVKARGMDTERSNSQSATTSKTKKLFQPYKVAAEEISDEEVIPRQPQCKTCDDTVANKQLSDSDEDVLDLSDRPLVIDIPPEEDISEKLSVADDSNLAGSDVLDVSESPAKSVMKQPKCPQKRSRRTRHRSGGKSRRKTGVPEKEDSTEVSPVLTPSDLSCDLEKDSLDNGKDSGIESAGAPEQLKGSPCDSSEGRDGQKECSHSAIASHKVDVLDGAASQTRRLPKPAHKMRSRFRRIDDICASLVSKKVVSEQASKCTVQLVDGGSTNDLTAKGTELLYRNDSSCDVSGLEGSCSSTPQATSGYVEFSSSDTSCGNQKHHSDGTEMKTELVPTDVSVSECKPEISAEAHGASAHVKPVHPPGTDAGIKPDVTCWKSDEETSEKRIDSSKTKLSVESMSSCERVEALQKDTDSSGTDAKISTDCVSHPEIEEVSGKHVDSSKTKTELSPYRVPSPEVEGLVSTKNTDCSETKETPSVESFSPEMIEDRLANHVNSVDSKTNISSKCPESQTSTETEADAPAEDIVSLETEEKATVNCVSSEIEGEMSRKNVTCAEAKRKLSREDVDSSQPERENANLDNESSKVENESSAKTVVLESGECDIGKPASDICVSKLPVSDTQSSAVTETERGRHSGRAAKRKALANICKESATDPDEVPAKPDKPAVPSQKKKRGRPFQLKSVGGEKHCTTSPRASKAELPEKPAPEQSKEGSESNAPIQGRKSAGKKKRSKDVLKNKNKSFSPSNSLPSSTHCSAVSPCEMLEREEDTTDGDTYHGKSDGKDTLTNDCITKRFFTSHGARSKFSPPYMSLSTLASPSARISLSPPCSASIRKKPQAAVKTSIDIYDFDEDDEETKEKTVTKSCKQASANKSAKIPSKGKKIRRQKSVPKSPEPLEETFVDYTQNVETYEPQCRFLRPRSRISYSDNMPAHTAHKTSASVKRSSVPVQLKISKFRTDVVEEHVNDGKIKRKDDVSVCRDDEPERSLSPLSKSNTKRHRKSSTSSHKMTVTSETISVTTNEVTHYGSDSDELQQHSCPAIRVPNLGNVAARPDLRDTSTECRYCEDGTCSKHTATHSVRFRLVKIGHDLWKSVSIKDDSVTASVRNEMHDGSAERSLSVSDEDAMDDGLDSGSSDGDMPDLGDNASCDQVNADGDNSSSPPVLQKTSLYFSPKQVDDDESSASSTHEDLDASLPPETSPTVPSSATSCSPSSLVTSPKHLSGRTFDSINNTKRNTSPQPKHRSKSDNLEVFSHDKQTSKKRKKTNSDRWNVGLPSTALRATDNKSKPYEASTKHHRDSLPSPGDTGNVKSRKSKLQQTNLTKQEPSCRQLPINNNARANLHLRTVCNNSKRLSAADQISQNAATTTDDTRGMFTSYDNLDVKLQAANDISCKVNTSGELNVKPALQSSSKLKYLACVEDISDPESSDDKEEEPAKFGTDGAMPVLFNQVTRTRADGVKDKIMTGQDDKHPVEFAIPTPPQKYRPENVLEEAVQFDSEMSQSSCSTPSYPVVSPLALREHEKHDGIKPDEAEEIDFAESFLNGSTTLSAEIEEQIRKQQQRVQQEKQGQPAEGLQELVPSVEIMPFAPDFQDMDYAYDLGLIPMTATTNGAVYGVLNPAEINGKQVHGKDGTSQAELNSSKSKCSNKNDKKSSEGKRRSSKSRGKKHPVSNKQEVSSAPAHVDNEMDKLLSQQSVGFELLDDFEEVPFSTSRAAASHLDDLFESGIMHQAGSNQALDFAYPPSGSSDLPSGGDLSGDGGLQCADIIDEAKMAIRLPGSNAQNPISHGIDEHRHLSQGSSQDVSMATSAMGIHACDCGAQFNDQWSYQEHEVFCNGPQLFNCGL